VNIEVVCSNADEHRQRVEGRHSPSSGARTPTWSEVETREYHDWTVERIVVDTSSRSAVECVDELISVLTGKLA
jgi:hypothetical protein